MEDALIFHIEDDELEMFLEDANELLQEIESGILRLEQHPELVEGQAADLEALNATFRAAHTLKAMAGAIGHHQMAELTHTVETLFDELREAGQAPTQALTDELLTVVDVLKAQRDEVVTRQPSDVDVNGVLARLHALMEDDDGRDTAQKESLSVQRLTPEQTAQAETYHKEGQAILEVEVVASSAGFAPAARLMQAAMGLAEVGQVIAQHPSEDGLLNAQQDGCLWLVLATEVETNAVEKLLSDVSELARFHVQPYALDAPAATAAPSDGSCVAVCLYDPVKKVGGMLHALLPSAPNGNKDPGNPTKFVDQGVPLLIEALSKLGARRNRLKAQLCGGANVLSAPGLDGLLSVGKRNVQAAETALRAVNLQIQARSTGGNTGRTVKLYVADGKVTVRSLGQAEQLI